MFLVDNLGSICYCRVRNQTCMHHIVHLRNMNGKKNHNQNNLILLYKFQLDRHCNTYYCTSKNQARSLYNDQLNQNKNGKDDHNQHNLISFSSCWEDNQSNICSYTKTRLFYKIHIFHLMNKCNKTGHKLHRFCFLDKNQVDSFHNIYYYTNNNCHCNFHSDQLNQNTIYMKDHNQHSCFLISSFLQDMKSSIYSYKRNYLSCK